MTGIDVLTCKIESFAVWQGSTWKSVMFCHRLLKLSEGNRSSEDLQWVLWEKWFPQCLWQLWIAEVVSCTLRSGIGMYHFLLSDSYGGEASSTLCYTNQILSCNQRMEVCIVLGRGHGMSSTKYVHLRGRWTWDREAASRSLRQT